VEGHIEVLKLDIEGAEIDVIDSLPDDLIRRIAQLTIEFHDWLGYYSETDVATRVDRIAALGFRELFWSRKRNSADVLLINGSRLGRLRYAFEHQVVRPLRAVGRAAHRLYGNGKAV